jgi:protein-disulfide isomerase
MTRLATPLLSRRTALVLPALLALAPAFAQESKPAEAKPVAAATPAGDPKDLNTPGPLGDRVLGNADAPVTVVEYASFTCSHCANFHENTFPTLKEKYIDTGKVRFIYREFPLDPLSTAASMLARCAPEPRFFPMASVFFKQQRQWAGSDKPLDELLAIARQAGFSKESFEACLNNKEVFNGLNEQKKRAVDFHKVDSTPSFFVNGQLLRGDTAFDEMAKVIEAKLKK